MKRDTLRTESDTSHSTITCGFSLRLRSKTMRKGTPPYWRFLRMVSLESNFPRRARLRRMDTTLRRRWASLVTASCMADLLLGEVVEALLCQRLQALLVAARHVLALQLAAHQALDHIGQVLEPAVEVGLQAARVGGREPGEQLLQPRQLQRQAREPERLRDRVREAA